MKKNSSNTEESLRKSDMPMGNAGKNAAGLKQGVDDAPAGEGSQETRRHGSKPKPEAVREAQHDASAQKRAHGFNERSIKGGAEKEGGW
jgi:hypothetical protein